MQIVKRKNMTWKNYPEGFVTPRDEIAKMIETLTLDKVDIVAARLQAVVNILGRSSDSPIDEKGLQLLRQIARESRGRRYQSVMKAIVEAAESDPFGKSAAYRTATFALELAFRWTPEYFDARSQYLKRLRRIRFVSVSSR